MRKLWNLVCVGAGALLLCHPARAQNAEPCFVTPVSVAVDNQGNIFVADSNKKVICKVGADGKVAAFAGMAGAAGHADGAGATARFENPNTIAADNAGNVYVADGYKDFYVRKISPQGVVSTLAGNGGPPEIKDGVGATASFRVLGGIATDRAGNVYVVDGGTIRKVTAEGKVTTIAGNPKKGGDKDGIGADATFGRLLMYGLTTDAAGNIYVGDRANNAIRKISPQGRVTTLWREKVEYTEGEESEANIMGVASDDAGNIYVSDDQLQVIFKISPSGVKTHFAGSIYRRGQVNGKGSAAAFDDPEGIATDRKGNVYVSDTHNFIIRKITPDGTVTTVAGTPGTQEYYD